ncbi:MAG: hypothetical protein CMC14_03310 [Flavobacteriaceae bacterium]|nr:hypothetical protein [Flavobacteriaceae bacterium]|tara:strand:+ start:52980 stop:53573 length:594 start_codon:yes stop_codon:yes gene_type:complete
MKNIITLIAFSFSLLSISQETELVIVKANSTWGKEIIPFPIEWAPKFTFEGFEELRFAPEWDKKESEQFWTLVMAWEVNTDVPLTEKSIAFNFEHYFDALMNPNHWATTFPAPSLLLVDITNKDYLLKDKPTKYKGKLKVFDGFHSGEMISLNLLAEVLFCPNKQKSIILFRISPQNTSAPIWNELNAIEVLPEVCQ